MNRPKVTEGVSQNHESAGLHPDLAKWYTVAVAAVYILGFVIVNTFNGFYGLARSDLLSARYLAAGLSPVVFAGLLGGVVVATAGGVSKAVAAIDKAGTVSELPEAAWLFPLIGGIVALGIIGSVAYVAYVVWMYELMPSVLVAALRKSEYISHTVSVGYFLGTTTLSVAAVFGWSIATESAKWFDSGIVNMIGSLLGVGALVVLVTFYGWRVYPYIRPAFGGGGAAIVLIAFKDNSYLERDPDLRRPMAIVDRDDKFLWLLECRDRPQHDTRRNVVEDSTRADIYSVALPTEAVTEITQIAVGPHPSLSLARSLFEYTDTLQRAGCGYLPTRKDSIKRDTLSRIMMPGTSPATGTVTHPRARLAIDGTRSDSSTRLLTKQSNFAVVRTSKKIAPGTLVRSRSRCGLAHR